MSQQLGVREVGIASLAQLEALADADDVRLKKHYIWNPFDDIRLVGPDGLRIRLGKGKSFYGQGRPGESYENYMARRGDSLRRCFLYPIDNIQYEETVYNLGKFTRDEAEGGSGNTLEKRQAAKTETRHQTAGVCAADFVSIWGESHGARSLEPLIGLDEATAEELFLLVQPMPYKLTSDDENDQETLLYDLTHTAPLRINGAGLDAELQKIAFKLRDAMRGGVLQAIKTAREAWEELHKELNNAKNSRPGKSTPTVYDEQVAFLLGHMVPASVTRPGADLETAIMKFLTVANQQSVAPPADITEGQTLLAEIRAEREALRVEREAFEAQKKKAR